MTQRTCDIIWICKHSQDDALTDIASYMSNLCMCPVEAYTETVLLHILTEAIYDYIDGCDKPSFFLKTLARVYGLLNNLTSAELITNTFALVDIMDNGFYVNGFTQELVANSENLEVS